MAELKQLRALEEKGGFDGPYVVPTDIELRERNEKHEKQPENGTGGGGGDGFELEETEMSKGMIIKNLIVVSVGFMLLFTAFQSLASLQSTLNDIGNLGVISQSVLYASLVVSCMFVPKTVVSYLGCKWAVVFSMLTYFLYVAANFYPRDYTLIPAAVILGIGAAPLWSAKCSYLTDIGAKYARLSGETTEAVVTRFFGIFFLFFQSSTIIGHTISSQVLQPGGDYDKDKDNRSALIQYCGAKFCPNTFEKLNYSNPNLAKPDDLKRNIVIGVFSACAISAAIVVAVGLTNLRRAKDINKKPFSFSLLVATFQQLKLPEQLVVIPITMYSGLEQGYLNADFTKSFVGCSLGIWNIGLVLICYGVTDAFMSFATGHIVKYTGRIAVFIAGMAVNVTSIVVMLMWTPNADQIWAFYLLGAALGFTDAIWQTQINALYGCLFGDESEAAFSNYRMWESLGFIIAFAYSGYLCTNIKLYVLLSVLLTGMAGYFVAEYMVRKKDKDRE